MVAGVAILIESPHQSIGKCSRPPDSIFAVAKAARKTVKKKKARKTVEKKKATAAMTKRWEFMQSWCKPVLGCLELLTDRLASPFGIGLEVKLSLRHHMDPHALASVRQALLLLSLLAGVDREGFKQVLRDYCIQNLSELEADAIDEAVASVFIDVVVLTPISNTDDDSLASIDSSSCLSALRAGDLDSCGSDHARLALILKNFFCCEDQPASREFADTARKIAGLADESQFKVNVPVRVTVAPGDGHDRIHHSSTHGQATAYFDVNFAGLMAWTMLELLTLGKGWRFPLKWESEDGCLDWSMEINSFHINIPIEELTPLITTPFQALVTSGSGLSISILELSYKAAPACFKDALKLTTDRAYFFERILCANTSSEGEDSIAKVDRLTVADLASSDFALQRFFSALAEARTTRSFTLLLNDKDDSVTGIQQSKLWEGIAYAFFSKHAHSSIEHLVVEGDLICVLSAERVAEVLAAENPLVNVFGSSDSDSNDGCVKNLLQGLHDGRYMLHEGTKLLFHELDEFMASRYDMFPARDGSEETENGIQEGGRIWTLQTDVVGVRVISGDLNGASFVKVLVPGYGICWVAAQAVEEIIGSDDTISDESPCGVKSLKICVNYPTRYGEGLNRLLEIIGSSLTRLELFFPNEDVSLDFARLLASCPNLTSLIVRGISVDAQLLIEHCNTHQHWFSEVSCKFRNLRSLVNELQQEMSPFSRNLKSLSVNSIERGNSGEDFKAMAEMLNKNNTLHRLDVPTVIQMFKVHPRLLKTHHGEYLPAAKEPFPIECRLAFLSVVRRKREQPGVKRGEYDSETDGHVSPSLLLSQDVLLIIFGLAADPVQRRITTNLGLSAWFHSASYSLGMHSS